MCRAKVQVLPANSGRMSYTKTVEMVGDSWAVYPLPITLVGSALSMGMSWWGYSNGSWREVNVGWGRPSIFSRPIPVDEAESGAEL